MYELINYNTIKWKATKYHTVGTLAKYYWKPVEKCKIDTPNRQIHDHSLSTIQFLWKHLADMPWNKQTKFNGCYL
jgi:hypothetical protein